MELTGDTLVEVFDEGEGGGAVFRHAALGGEVGKVFVAEDGGFLVAEVEDFRDEGGVIELALGGDVCSGVPDVFAQLIVIGVLHDGRHGGLLEREPPCG